MITWLRRNRFLQSLALVAGGLLYLALDTALTAIAFLSFGFIGILAVAAPLLLVHDTFADPVYMWACLADIAVGIALSFWLLNKFWMYTLGPAKWLSGLIGKVLFALFAFLFDTSHAGSAPTIAADSTLAATAIGAKPKSAVAPAPPISATRYTRLRGRIGGFYALTCFVGLLVLATGIFNLADRLIDPFLRAHAWYFYIGAIIPSILLSSFLLIFDGRPLGGLRGTLALIRGRAYLAYRSLIGHHIVVLVVVTLITPGNAAWIPFLGVLVLTALLLPSLYS